MVKSQTKASFYRTIRTVEVRDKIKLGWELVKANPLVTVLAVALVALLVWYFGGSIKDAVIGTRTDRAVERLQKQSADLQEKAREEIGEAQKARGAREAEDSHRETEIKPRIERAARNRAAARAATQKAERDYEASLNDSQSASADLDDLRKRNCTDYAELYPADYERRCPQ